VETAAVLGAIADDIIGSVHETSGIKSKDFDLFTRHNRFTDDTVLTVAVADCLLNTRDYIDTFHEYFEAYPEAGFGGRFFFWAGAKMREPYNSWGNGSAMRVSPVAYAFDNLDEVLKEAKRTAEVTHNHTLGITGAQAVAAAVFLARTGKSKKHIRQFIEEEFDYSLTETLDQIRPTYQFDISCQGSVPQSIIAFLESESVEDAIRNAISLGGDADTMACNSGAIAEPFYGGVPREIADPVLDLLDERLSDVVMAFRERYESP
jgi:ADP-ribosylglycohydrolase